MACVRATSRTRCETKPGGLLLSRTTMTFGRTQVSRHVTLASKRLAQGPKSVYLDVVVDRPAGIAPGLRSAGSHIRCTGRSVRLPSQIEQEFLSSDTTKQTSKKKHPRQKSECIVLHCMPRKFSKERVSLDMLDLENPLLGLKGPREGLDHSPLWIASRPSSYAAGAVSLDRSSQFNGEEGNVLIV